MAKFMLCDDDLIMNKYQIIESPIKLHTGLLQLTPEQAKDRMHQLERVEADIYMIKQPVATPVMFKVGEVIGYDGDIPKALLMNIVEAEVNQPIVDETEAAKSKKSKDK